MVELMLNKKNSSILVAYYSLHKVECCAASAVMKTAWVPNGQNLAEEFTKLFPSAMQDFIFGNWTYWCCHHGCVLYSCKVCKNKMHKEDWDLFDELKFLVQNLCRIVHENCEM